MNWLTSTHTCDKSFKVHSESVCDEVDLASSPSGGGVIPGGGGVSGLLSSFGKGATNPVSTTYLKMLKQKIMCKYFNTKIFLKLYLPSEEESEQSTSISSLLSCEFCDEFMAAVDEEVFFLNWYSVTAFSLSSVSIFSKLCSSLNGGDFILS